MAALLANRKCWYSVFGVSVRSIFCRELCEVTLFGKREKLDGPGKVIQIDELKISAKENIIVGTLWKGSGFSVS